MTEARDIEAFQAEVAWTALGAIGGQGFALAGAGALIAHGLVDRLTQDLDLFSPMPGGAGHVIAMLQQVPRAAGFQGACPTARLCTIAKAQRCWRSYATLWPAALRFEKRPSARQRALPAAVAAPTVTPRTLGTSNMTSRPGQESEWYPRQ